MRIKGTDSSPVDSGGTRAVERVRRTTPAASGGSPAQSGADSVHITDSARQLASLEQAIHEVPDVDAQRVAAVHHGTRDGAGQSASHGHVRAERGHRRGTDRRSAYRGRAVLAGTSRAGSAPGFGEYFCVRPPKLSAA